MAAALLLAVPLAGCATGGPPALTIGLALDPTGPADASVNGLVAATVAATRNRLGRRVATVRTFTARPGERDQDKYQRLAILCGSGADPVIAVGAGYAGADPANGPLARAAHDCPSTRFALLDDASVRAPNVAALAFADDQGAYLMGVAAALRAGAGPADGGGPTEPGTGTGAVALLAGCRTPAVVAAAAAYRAGALAARPGTRVEVAYLATDPADCAARYADPDAARAAAATLYATGAGVVYQLTGAAVAGVLTAAKAADGLVIGSGVDQYPQFGPPLRTTLLTSLRKRVDRVLDRFLTAVAAGRFQPGIQRGTLKSGDLGYATSGEYIAALSARLDIDKQEIIDGRVTLPDQP